MATEKVSDLETLPCTSQLNNHPVITSYVESKQSQANDPPKVFQKKNRVQPQTTHPNAIQQLKEFPAKLQHSLLSQTSTKNVNQSQCLQYGEHQDYQQSSSLPTPTQLFQPSLDATTLQHQNDSENLALKHKRAFVIVGVSIVIFKTIVNILYDAAFVRQYRSKAVRTRHK